MHNKTEQRSHISYWNVTNSSVSRPNTSASNYFSFSTVSDLIVSHIVWNISCLEPSDQCLKLHPLTCWIQFNIGLNLLLTLNSFIKDRLQKKVCLSIRILNRIVYCTPDESINPFYIFPSRLNYFACSVCSYSIILKMYTGGSRKQRSYFVNVSSCVFYKLDSTWPLPPHTPTTS